MDVKIYSGQAIATIRRLSAHSYQGLNVRKINNSPEKSVVMIIDDQQAMRMLIKTTMKHMGFRQFAESPNGHEALKRLKLMNIDLIICDWDMPQMNGLELLIAIRADERLSKIPFIMLTANSSSELIHQCISADVDSYIVKPFQPSALCKKVNNMMPDSTSATT